VKQHKNFGLYLRRFRTEFGRKINPSIIMVRDDAPLLYRRVDALSSFRNVLAISAIVHTWARIFEFGRGQDGTQYANTFAFYPWMLDKDYNGVSTRSMAMLGYETDVKLMQAQSTAAIATTWLVPQMLDKALLDALLVRWERRYSGRSPAWKDRALFRSLNMATAAAMLPAHGEITDFDIGRHAALWVSAFEILAHPKHADSGFKQVYALLEKAKWNNSRCSATGYQAYFGRNTRSDRTLPCWIYGELNHARNDYLHGNPVRNTRLTTKRSKRGLFFYATPLYRMALTAFLDLRWKEKQPPKRDLMARIQYEDRKFDFQRYQRGTETALTSIKYTESEWSDLRTSKLKHSAVKWP
jgi:hypothetical protein